MKIATVALMRIPTEKAHGYQTMRVLSELARLGHRVALWVPKRHNHITEDPFEYYGLHKNFTINYVPCTDYLRFAWLLGPLAFRLTMRSFLRNLAVPSGMVVYTRDADAVASLSARGFVCIYNVHNWEWRRAARLKGARGVVCNTKGTQAAVRQALSIPTTVAYNATDPNPYVGGDKQALRSELGLPTDKKIVLYAGHLYGWKGTNVLVEAARTSTSPDTLFVIVGGTPKDVEQVRAQIGDIANVHLLGHQPKVLIPKFLVAADVLVLPNTAQTQESRHYTSPIKMFEYMASGTPIVASDLPSLREVLSPSSAYFAKAGDAEALLQAIEEVLQEPQEAQARAERALKEASNHTWEAHAKRVAEFIASLV